MSAPKDAGSVIPIVEHASLDSTNEEIRRLASAGETGPLWVRADAQTAGRGRRGRGWVSPQGNLMASLLVRPTCALAQSAQVSFVAALAVCDLARKHIDADRVQVKWPNDVLAGGRKLSGILLEAGPVHEGRADWLCIGIGVNLRAHPQDSERPATDFRAEGAQEDTLPSPCDALHALSDHISGWLGIWDNGAGFPAIRSAWLDRAHGLGRPVTARLSDRELTGRFDGLDNEGGLILTDAEGVMRIVHGGEVFFPGSTTPPEPGA